MKKISLFMVILLILVQLLTFPVFASMDDEPGFIWTILDVIGDFFTSLIQTIVNLGKSIYETVMKGIEFLLSGLKMLFIPHDDYFDRLTDRLFAAFEKKFGSILALADHLKSRFTDLRAYKGELFVIQFPKSHLFGGWRIDLLNGSDGIAGMVRGAFSGFIMLSTVAFCYKKVVSMINT